MTYMYFELTGGYDGELNYYTCLSGLRAVVVKSLAWLLNRALCSARRKLGNDYVSGPLSDVPIAREHYDALSALNDAQWDLRNINAIVEEREIEIESKVHTAKRRV